MKGGGGGERKKTYSNTDLSGVSSAEGSRPIRIPERRGVAHRSSWQREANHAVILNEENGHAEVCLLYVAAPVGLVWGAPYLLRDDGEAGQGNKVEEPERVLVVRERVGARAGHGRLRDHQRVWPARYVADQGHLPRVHLEERLEEECRVSFAEHPHEIPVAVGERDLGIERILVILGTLVILVILGTLVILVILMILVCVSVSVSGGGPCDA